jgi:hypothetical protein
VEGSMRETFIANRGETQDSDRGFNTYSPAFIGSPFLALAATP